MRKKVVLISCVKSKLHKKAKAEYLYISTLFKLNLEYARILRPDSIYVLSAKHGLIRTDQIVEPYEKTLNNMKAQDIRNWSTQVIRQLKNSYSLEQTEFTFLAGIKYRKYLLPYLKHYNVPLEGLTFGKQLHRLKELTK